MVSKKVHKDLGNRIKTIRTEKKMKIVDVARESGLTSSMISQVERSIISPSIDTLKKISEVLNVPIASFFDDGEDIPNEQNVHESLPNKTLEKSPVVRFGQRKVLSPGPGVTFNLLNPDLSGPIEFIYNRYEPGTGTGNDLYSHPGFECGLILEGELAVRIEENEYVLKKGDSISFSSEKPHSKTNKGDVPCVCVWANTPPWF